MFPGKSKAFNRNSPWRFRLEILIKQIQEFDQGFGLSAVNSFAGKTQMASFVP